MVDAPVENSSTAPPEAAGSPRPPLLARLTVGGVAAVGCLPFSLRSVMGWSFGYLAGLLPLRERSIAKLQLQVFLPGANADRLTPRVFANAGRTLFESLRLTPILRVRASRITCEAWPTITTWLASDRPIVALTAHTGNWDLLAGYMIAQGIPLTTIGKEARNPTAQHILSSIRSGYGIETIWRSDRSGVKRLLQCLRERRTIAALIDQDTRVDSTMIPFFGTPAKTPSSLVALGRKANARFVSAFMFRTGFMRYKVFVEELPSSLNDAALLAEYHRHLERLVRLYPDQWVWFHKRWRTLLDGRTLSTKEYLAELTKRLAEKPCSPSTQGCGNSA
jgi:KDO2-lipid IV(A) lauroyltransferase